MITVESNPKHAEFARARFTDAHVADQVELVEGLALDRVDGVAGEDAFDVIFLDADKRDYPQLATRLKGSLRVGGLLIADNALGSSRWWIDQAPAAADFGSAADHPMAVASREAADQFGRMMGRRPRLRGRLRSHPRGCAHRSQATLTQRDQTGAVFFGRLC